MQTTTIPNRASDAGPNADPEMDWRDHLFEAEHFAGQAWRDSEDPETSAKERARRIHALETAISHLEQAKALLAPPTAADLAGGLI